MIRRVSITFATILGLLAATHGSVAFGAIRWGGDVLRQQPEWYVAAKAYAKWPYR